MTGKRKGTALTPQQRPRQRVSQQMRSVIDLMVHEGLPLPIAAQRVGMNVESAKRAERKQPARNLYNQMVANVRKGAAQQAYLGIVHQSHSADSERLQYDAKRWVAGVDGISPVQKVQGQHHHSHSFEGFGYPDLEAIDGEATDSQDDD